MKIITSLLTYYFGMITLFFAGRAALFTLYFDRFREADFNYWLVFLHGLRMDTIVAALLLVVPLLVMTLAPKAVQKPANAFLVYYFLLVFLILIYVEVATFPFVAEYDVRPNYLFVEYLEYPKEVFNTIIAQYKLELAVAFFMMAAFGYAFIRLTRTFNFTSIFEIHYLKRLALLLPLFVILAIGTRSSFGHRPANISDAMYSPNRLVNEITKNSIHSIGYAVYANKKYSSQVIDGYGKMDVNEALSRVSKRLNIPVGSEKAPFSRMARTRFPKTRPKNLVLFIQESIGAQFVEATGGAKGITPFINKLSREGILFTNLYSNGTRSIRGIAGIVSGMLSVPGKGVIKRNRSQSDFFTISSLLEPYGYHTMFLYGGESRFDNMKGWFLGNGFDEIIDEQNFVNPQFTGTWGVSDEDLVLRANEEFRRLHADNQPFAAVMFSTSNHAPFDFPEGKIDLVEGVPERSDTNAIKYADYAIGRFIEEAKRQPYYNDTVIVIVADHNVRVYGDSVVPVHMFHIPGLIVGGGIEAQVIDELTSQPDILATALDLVGLDLTYPILGKSAFDEEKKDVSLMQFNDFYALRSGTRVAVIRPNLAPSTFLYKDENLVPIGHDIELEKDALAFIVTLNHLYEKRLFKQAKITTQLPPHQKIMAPSRIANKHEGTQLIDATF